MHRVTLVSRAALAGIVVATGLAKLIGPDAGIESLQVLIRHLGVSASLAESVAIWAIPFLGASEVVLGILIWFRRTRGVAVAILILILLTGILLFGAGTGWGAQTHVPCPCGVGLPELDWLNPMVALLLRQAGLFLLIALALRGDAGFAAPSCRKRMLHTVAQGRGDDSG